MHVPEAKQRVEASRREDVGYGVSVTNDVDGCAQPVHLKRAVDDWQRTAKIELSAEGDEHHDDEQRESRFDHPPAHDRIITI